MLAGKVSGGGLFGVPTLLSAAKEAYTQNCLRWISTADAQLTPAIIYS
jgi:hypothetical protein